MYAFGTFGQTSVPFRDAEDLVFTQYVLDMWTAFGRTFDPNPDVAWLRARGHTSTIEQIALSGTWEAVLPSSITPLMVLNGKLSGAQGWVETDQCTFVGFPLDYFG